MLRNIILSVPLLLAPEGFIYQVFLKPFVHLHMYDIAGLAIKYQRSVIWKFLSY